MTSEPKRLEFQLTGSRGRTITADICSLPSETAKPLIVFVHGFKGFKDWGHFNLLSSYFARRGFVFCKLNLSHNGVTPEHPTEHVDLEAFANNNLSIELDDLGFLLDYLETRPQLLREANYDMQKLGLLGHSRGGALVILKAVEEPRVKCLATWSAISTFIGRYTPEKLAEWKEKGVIYELNARTKQLMPLRYQLLQDYEQYPERLNIPVLAGKVTQPWLIVHGEADDVVPLSMALDLKKINPSATLQIIKGGNHSFGGAHPYPEQELPSHTQQAADSTITFFKQHLHD